MFNSKNHQSRETGSKTVTDRKRLMRQLTTATLTIGSLVLGSPSHSNDDNAMAILKAMSDYV